MSATLIVGNEGNYAEVTAAGKLKVETDAELTLTSIETEIQGTLDVGGTAAHDAAASGNPVQVGGVYRTVDPAVANGDVASLRVNAAGELIVDLPAIPAGTNLIGKVGIDQTTVDANKVVTTTGSITTATLGAGTALAGKFGIDQVTANANNVQVKGENAAAHESVTIADTAGGVALTAGTYGTNIYALITAETAQMRFTVDGTAPTTTVGHLLNHGDTLELDSLADITAFRAIRTGSVSGVIKVTYSGVA